MELKKEQINKLEKILELIADNPTADEVAEIVQGLLKQIKLLREDTEREHSKIKKETNETINSLWNSFTKNLKNLEDKLKELNNKSEKEKVRLQTNFFEGLNKEIKAIERKIPDLRPLQKELENKLQNEIKNLKGEIEGIDLIKEINSSDGGIDKEKIKGLSDELKRIEKKSVGGGTRGIQLYTGGEKRGMAQMMNLIAGTGVTLNHDYASGRNDITISASGSFGVLEATGTIDDSNTTFTFTEKPVIIYVNGQALRENKGWTWSVNTATLSNPVGDDGDIYGIK